MWKKKLKPMSTKQEFQLEGKHGKPILTDLYLSEQPGDSLVIFCHGYKGFKDWGFWEQAARAFNAAGHHFIKFNFSHNGGTPEQPIDFPDLEAFAMNNFTKEMDDLQTVINWSLNGAAAAVDLPAFNQLTLVGHSRGGGIVTLKAAEEDRVNRVITWAAVSDFKARFGDQEARAWWKKNGVIHVENSRTKQQMPHYYQFYEDFMANEERFTIKRAVSGLKQPLLIIHGTEDPTVSIEEARALNSWNEQAHLKIIPGADHVFGGSHPWMAEKLPPHMEQVVKASLDFIQ